MITTLLLSSEKIKVTAQLTEIDILLIALIEFILETIAVIQLIGYAIQ